ncbi:MAG TPA: helix-turn-helix domain-containing protein [Gemmataceae bacterium]|nr:helix-turn-helix domain-containing protein [Gemmataceae bacterium]
MPVSSSAICAFEELSFSCPVEATLNVIGGKWKVVILFNLTSKGTLRFAELRRRIPGISERMLTQQLRELERDDIVHREVYAEVPPKVEYSLTEYGMTLRPITEAMCKWGRRHTERLSKQNGAMRNGKSK